MFLTTWCLLLLLPYLGYAIIGELPHSHHHEGASPTTVRSTLPMPAHQAVLTTDDCDDPDHCPLCQTYAAFSSCAAVFVCPWSLFPPVATYRINTYQHLITRILLSSTSSRAPPAV